MRFLIAAVMAVCASFATAAVKVPLKIDAGDTDRHNTPVAATLKLGQDLSSHDADTLANAKVAKLAPSNTIVQLEPVHDTNGKLSELIARWIEPDLKAHDTQKYELVPLNDSSASTDSFHFTDGDGYRDLLFSDQPIYRHMMPRYDPADRDNTLKPFHHLYGMHHEGYITKGPGGMETHHRGLFFGFSTQYGNFWACKDVAQRHVKNLDEREFAGPVVARSTSVVDWIAKDGKPVVRDTREVTTWRAAPDETILDFDITVQSLVGEVKLTGDPHHGGFHFRAAEEVAEQTAPSANVKSTTHKATLHTGGATYLRPSGAKFVKDDIWSNTPWVACMFSVKNNPYIVLHMDAPTNPKPTLYSTRPYGRFGAFFTTTVKQNEPLKLHYRIVLLDGKTHPNATAEALAPMYTDFVDGPRVTFPGSD